MSQHVTNAPWFLRATMPLSRDLPVRLPIARICRMFSVRLPGDEPTRCQVDRSQELARCALARSAYCVDYRRWCPLQAPVWLRESCRFPVALFKVA
jgi:hypothetical protein